ncbi:uncharacterized protein N7483_002520 [Penicillium malachiteum]|uniref:uncharacterized protein n=1 Tax=Penicillium malachiteum TaxID=1324776 RepID=UPI00254847CC|nr:uncharacterized protein N7483_002520 [Penicillium malachiteum]KAJ5737395.1 hypothetical protein N7483_002520 [Penicillium malachiteum]
MDGLKQSLVKLVREEYSLAGSVMANKAAQAVSTTNKQEENALAVDKIELKDLKSFEKRGLVTPIQEGHGNA